MLSEGEEKARDDMLACIDRLEGIKRKAWDMRDAMQDLVFWSGQLPDKDTRVHTEFVAAYRKAADFFRDDELARPTHECICPKCGLRHGGAPTRGSF